LDHRAIKCTTLSQFCIFNSQFPSPKLHSPIMFKRALTLMLGLFVVGMGMAGGYVQYRYLRFLALREEAMSYCNRGEFQHAREIINVAFDYAPDSEARASAAADRRRFRFGFCEDYSGGNY